MMTVTPGADLHPITRGRDFVFVLDKSGSMRSGKYAALIHSVGLALEKMRAEDRFRIVLFNNKAQEFTQGFQSATSDNITNALNAVRASGADGGTNLYAGM